MTWDEYFYSVAFAVAGKSNCYSVKRGVVIARGKHIISTGFNGPPSGVKHCDERFRDWLEDGTINLIRKSHGMFLFTRDMHLGEKLCPRQVMGFSSSQGLEWCAGAHAEINAIAHAARLGVNVEGATMYCSFDCLPCRECSKAIVNAGIREVVVVEKIEYHKETGVPSSIILSEGNVPVRIYVENN